MEANEWAHREENITPWDYGQHQPPLKKLLESKVLDLSVDGRALVPGCGTVSYSSFIGLIPLPTFIK